MMYNKTNIHNSSVACRIIDWFYRIDNAEYLSIENDTLYALDEEYEVVSIISTYKA